MILTLPNLLWVCVGWSMILTLPNFLWVCVGWLMILTLPNFLWVCVGWLMILTLPHVQVRTRSLLPLRSPALHPLSSTPPPFAVD
jgi:hypothetical protein